MRIAVDIDSTLHHYWDLLSDVSMRRFGIDLPYEEQLTWGITRLKPEQLSVCIEETHSDENIARGMPYPGAVEAIARWRAAGHWVLVASHRDPRCVAATERWLNDIGVHHDALYCAFDKVAECVRGDVDLLIDDSPENLSRALDHGIVAATLTHPWNRDVCDVEPIIGAGDWPELERLLEPLLSSATRAPAA